MDNYTVDSYQTREGGRYFGTLCHGAPQGLGTCVWPDGDQYDGEWRNGQMHGIGTYLWNNGQRYDGEFREGKRDGIGVKTYVDGCMYDGFWKNGKRHGLGVFRPATKDRVPPSEHLNSTLVVQNAARVSDDPPPEDEMQSGSSAERASSPQSLSTTEAKLYICEYCEGKLIREESLSAEEVKTLFGFLWSKSKGGVAQRVKRLVRRNPRFQTKLGEVVYKGHHSFELMLSLQLGLRYSVGKMLRPSSSKDPPNLRGFEVAERDFTEKNRISFPHAGSNTTPAHPSSDFTWSDYCPKVFRQLRREFGLEEADYMLSLAGSAALRQLNTPGKSGSVFFLSEDERFLVKTMKKSEKEVLLDMLPSYYQHIQRYPNTLITRFFGLHAVTPTHGRKVRFVVMANIFQTDLQIHRRYDIKGSTLGRTAGPAAKDPPEEHPTLILKDLDLDMRINLDKQSYSTLMEQVQEDAQFLMEAGVMDYSLLLGVHYVSRYPSKPSQDNVAAGLDATGLETLPSLEFRSSYEQLDSGFGTPKLENQLSDASDAMPEAYLRLPIEKWQGRRGSGGGAGDGRLMTEETSHSAKNFDVYRGTDKLEEKLRVIEEKMKDLNYSEQRRQDVLGLVRLKMLGSKMKKTHARRTPPPASLLQAMQDHRSGEAHLGLTGARESTDGNSDSPRARLAVGPLISMVPQEEVTPTRCPAPVVPISLNKYIRGMVAGMEEDDPRGGPESPKYLTVGHQGGLPNGLGHRMLAHAIPKEPGAPVEEVVVCFGIIDILQDYSMRKVLERQVKAVNHERFSISVAPPGKYAKRFVDFIYREVFVNPLEEEVHESRR